MRRHLLALIASLLFLAPFAAAQEKRVEMDEATKKATATALAWLKTKQNPDGSYSDGAYVKNTAITAFAMLAFMSQGHAPDKGEYGPEVAKAARFLVASQREADGYLIGDRGGNMYCHAFAMLALAELCGQTGDANFSPTIRKAIDVIVRAQSPAGGWRYEPRLAGADCSITNAQLLALRTAKETGFAVPEDTLKKAIAYLKTCRRGNDGGFSYMANGGASTFANTAGALLMLHGDLDEKSLAAGVRVLNTRFESPAHFFHGHFYAAPAMHQVGGKEWEEWYEKLVKRFLVDGKQAPDGFWHMPGREIGPIYQTSIVVMCLSTPMTYPKKYKPIEKEIVAKKVELPINSFPDAAARLELLAQEQFELHLQSAKVIRALEMGGKADLPPSVRMFVQKHAAGAALRQQADRQSELSNKLKQVENRLREIALKPDMRMTALDELVAKVHWDEAMADAAKKLRTVGYPEARLKQFGLANAGQRQLAQHLQDAALILRGKESNRKDLADARAGIDKLMAAQKKLAAEIRMHVQAKIEKKDEPAKKVEDKLTLPGLEQLPKIGTPAQKQAALASAAFTELDRNAALADRQSLLAFELRSLLERAKRGAPDAAPPLEIARKAMSDAVDRMAKSELLPALEAMTTAGENLAQALSRIDRAIGALPPEKNDLNIEKK